MMYKIPMFLKDILIIDFSQFLSVPSAALRMADMGARVIKVERPEMGDICRTLYVSEVTLDNGGSTIFHAINRNKESLVADLKSEKDKEFLLQLIEHADVMLHNFRPGVMERLGFGYTEIKKINPNIIYGEISGYGVDNDWSHLPGQDLLVQAVSGLAYASGISGQPPVPMGVAVADILSGTHLVQGVLSALIHRLTTGTGTHVRINMLESTIDFQFEGFTAFLNGGPDFPPRAQFSPTNPYKPAPYGIYKTANDYIAIAGGELELWERCFAAPGYFDYLTAADDVSFRNKVQELFQQMMMRHTTEYWLQLADQYALPCSPVWDYPRLLEDAGYRSLKMEQWVGEGIDRIRTTRCPVRINGNYLTSNLAAPNLGQHTSAIKQEFSPSTIHN